VESFVEGGPGERKKTGAEWAEVCFVPNAVARSKNDPVLRYLAIRELLEQPELPGMEGGVKLPFPAMSMEKKRLRFLGSSQTGIWKGSELINWLHKRCGKSEERIRS